MIYIQRPYHQGWTSYLEIKGFKTDSAYRKFHFNRDTSMWSDYNGPLKSGKYVQDGWDTINGKTVARWKKI